MTTRTVRSFCRTCSAGCAMVLTIDEDDRIVQISGDRDGPMTKGYACFKGLQAAEAHHGPGRILTPQKRLPDGRFVTIPLEQALDEIADKLRAIIDAGGAKAVAMYIGSGAMLNGATMMVSSAFREALATPSYFTCSSIDQSSKFLTVGRLGMWGAGRHAICDSDVVMLVGTNPVVSHGTTASFTVAPMNALKKETARGMKVVVIDPRVTESAHFAEVHLQPYPGEDPTVIGGLLRIILSEGWEDKEFCDQFVKPGGLERMREAVAPFTPDYVTRRAGVPQDLLRKAAALFAHDSRTGAAFSATGPSMSPRGNLSDHLIECLNVVCGRLRRAGDRVLDINVCAPPRTLYAEVMPPTRSWEEIPPGRIRGAHSVWGEMFTCTLADEILTPGDGQIRALIVGGGNPVTAMPDQRKTVRAFKDLELLISIEPYMTTTAKLSHYILPPKLQYERADLPMALYGMSFYPVAWGQYTPEIIRPRHGSEVADDWYIYWGLAKRLGIALKYGDRPLDMDKTPTTDDLLAVRNEGAVVPFEEIRQYPSGNVWDIEGTVQPARPEATGRFDIMPDDLFSEMEEIAREDIRPGEYVSNGQSFRYRLAVRRSRDTVNSVGPMLNGVRSRNPYNPVWINPLDMADQSIHAGDKIAILSDHGRIEAIAASDDTVRRGVVMLNHGWGGLPDENLDYEDMGVSPNLLIDTETNIEPINSMVRMSAIPVNIQRLPNYRAGDELRA